MPQLTARQYAHQGGYAYSNVVNTLVNDYPPPVADNQNILRTKLVRAAAALTIGATAYFVYLGKTTRRISPQRILFYVGTVGAGAQEGEVGVFSSPTAPNRVAQTLTCLMKDGTLDDLATGTGVKGNTSVFTTSVAAGIHMWAGYRVDMATTEPTVTGVTQDFSNGEILSLASQTAFTVGSTYAGALIASSIAWQCPDLIMHVA